MSKSPSKVSSDFTRASHQRKCQSGTSASESFKVVQVTGESYYASTDGMLTYSQPPFSFNYPFKGNLLTIRWKNEHPLQSLWLTRGSHWVVCCASLWEGNQHWIQQFLCCNAFHCHTQD